jgi:probable HAF family extracellular repeat protein
MYTSADGRVHGFVLSGAGFTFLDVPDAVRTMTFAVNPAGVAVGPFLGPDGKTHGYRWSGSDYETVDVPGAVFTQPNGINARGDIVGFFRTADGVVRGFLESGGAFTAIHIPGLIQLRGISASGVIVGSYSDNGVTRGFVLRP